MKNSIKIGNTQISAKIADAMEKHYLRLCGELRDLKNRGVVPKSRRLNRSKMKRLIIALGTGKLENLSYQEFEELCKKLGV